MEELHVSLLSEEIKTESKKRIDIQHLRALAITVVLAFHLKPLFISQGFLGVDIFFVISGYLITSILNYGPSRSFTYSTLLNFYIKRIRRIFPVYYLIIFLTFLLCSPFLIYIDYETLKSDTVWSICFLSNIQSIFNHESYFQRINEDRFLLHTWSLSVEIQFYFIAPFLLYGISCLAFPATASAVIIALSWSFQTFFSNSTLTFGFIFARLWQFIVGTLVFYLEKQYFSILCSQRAKFFSYIISFFVLLLFTFVDFSTKLPFYSTVVARTIVTLFTGIIIFVGKENTYPDIGIISKCLTFIGDISYSLYLVHWPIIVLLKHVLLFDKLNLIGIIIFIFLITILQYKFFEKKIQQLSNFFIFGFIVVVVCLIVFKLLLPQNFGFVSLKMNEKVVNQNEEVLKNCDRQLAELRSCTVDVHFDIPSEGRGLDTYFCSYEGTGNATILLAGNSYVMREYESIIKFYSHKFKKLYIASQSICTVFTRHNDESWGCNFVSNRLQEIMKLLKPDITIITQRLSYGTLYNNPLNSYEEAKNDSVTAIFKEYWKEYSQLTKKIIIIEPNPTFFGTSKANYIKSLSSNGLLTDFYISEEDYNKEVNPGWWRILASIEECSVCSTIPIRQHFCHSNKKCDIYDSKTFLTLYCDPGHLSTVGVERFIKDLEKFLN